MKQEKNRINLLLVFIIIILAVLCILFATGTFDFKNKTNRDNNQTSNLQPNEIDSALLNNLYDIIGINWDGTYPNGDCLNYFLSNDNYKSDAEKIFSLYVSHKYMSTYRYDHPSCNEECKKALSCEVCSSILKVNGDKIIKLYNFDNLKLTELPGLDMDYFYASTGTTAGVCHFGITHDSSSEYIDSNSIRITDNQVVTDYVFGEDNKINSTKNQVVTYDFKKDSDGNYYLDNVTVK